MSWQNRTIWLLCAAVLATVTAVAAQTPQPRSKQTGDVGKKDADDPANRELREAEKRRQAEAEYARIFGNETEEEFQGRVNRTLFRALRDQNDYLVLGMLAEGAEPDARDDNGATPLLYAAHQGRVELVEHLLRKGASPRLSNIWGWTPLHAAAAQGHLSVAEVLVARGAPVNAVDFDGISVLAAALSNNQKTVAAFLRRKGARAKRSPWQPRLILIGAATYGRPDIVRNLLARGVKTGFRDHKGRTLVEVARDQAALARKYGDLERSQRLVEIINLLRPPTEKEKDDSRDSEKNKDENADESGGSNEM